MHHSNLSIHPLTSLIHFFLKSSNISATITKASSASPALSNTPYSLIGFFSSILCFSVTLESVGSDSPISLSLAESLINFYKNFYNLLYYKADRVNDYDFEKEISHNSRSNILFQLINRNGLLNKIDNVLFGYRLIL